MQSLRCNGGGGGVARIGGMTQAAEAQKAKIRCENRKKEARRERHTAVTGAVEASERCSSVYENRWMHPGADAAREIKIDMLSVVYSGRK